MSARRKIQYITVADVIADVEALRDGKCTAAGAWSLAQACWHLDQALQATMTPRARTDDTPTQKAMRVKLPYVFASRQISKGMPSPERLVPPVTIGLEAIESFLASLRKFDAFAGPYPTHPIFGNIPADEFRELTLIHCEHHLSHLVPDSSTR